MLAALVEGDLGVTKHLARSNFKEACFILAHGLRGCHPALRKARQKSSVGKRRATNAGTQLAFSLLFSQGWCHAFMGM